MTTLIEVTRFHCCLPVTKAQWNTLAALDKQDLADDVLFVKAIEAGVLKGTFEYNGHFGSNLFFEVEPPVDFEAIESEIYKVIGGPK